MNLRIISLLPLFSLMGCASTFTEKSTDWNPKEPVSALLVHFSVVDKMNQAGGSASLIEAVTAAVDKYAGKKSQLGRAGEKGMWLK